MQLTRCDPPRHAYFWSGDGVVRCHCRETAAELTLTNGKLVMKPVEGTIEGGG
jgi:hypothetical protein